MTKRHPKDDRSKRCLLVCRIDEHSVKILKYGAKRYRVDMSKFVRDMLNAYVTPEKYRRLHVEKDKAWRRHRGKKEYLKDQIVFFEEALKAVKLRLVETLDVEARLLMGWKNARRDIDTYVAHETTKIKKAKKK